MKFVKIIALIFFSTTLAAQASTSALAPIYGINVSSGFPYAKYNPTGTGHLTLSGSAITMTLDANPTQVVVSFLLQGSQPVMCGIRHYSGVNQSNGFYERISIFDYTNFNRRMSGCERMPPLSGIYIAYSSDLLSGELQTTAQIRVGNWISNMIPPGPVVIQ